MDEMKSPAKEQVDEALWNAGSGPAYILASAYRSAIARAELAERHAEQWRSFAFCALDESDEYREYRRISAMHERERKELEA